MRDFVRRLFSRMGGSMPPPPASADPPPAPIHATAGDPLDEYLERIFERAYDEELEKNESVWRTAPFLVAAFGLLTAAIGFIASKIPSPALGFWPIFNYLIFIAVLACFGLAYWHFFEMFRKRTYGYLSNATVTLDYARGLYASKLPSEGASIATVGELRKIMVEDLAATATASRESNRLRAEARSRAVFFLICASALAFLDSALIFTGDKVSEFTSTEGKENGPRAVAAPTPAAAAASPAATGIRPGGRQPAVPKSPAAVTAPVRNGAS